MKSQQESQRAPKLESQRESHLESQLKLQVKSQVESQREPKQYTKQDPERERERVQASAIPPDRPGPHSLSGLFLAFTVLALQGFGGVLAVVQRELVERRRWLSREEFLEDWAVAQIMPGPNVVNLAMMVGARYFGLPGALAALGGMLAVPLLVVLALVSLHAQFADNRQVAGALRGMAAVSAGLIAAAGLKLAAALRQHPLPPAWSVAICALGFVLVGLLRWPLAPVLVGLGGAACMLTWRRLR